MDICVYQGSKESLRRPFGVALTSRQMDKLILHRQKSVPSQSKGITAFANIAPANAVLLIHYPIHYPTRKLGRSPLMLSVQIWCKLAARGKDTVPHDKSGTLPSLLCDPKQHLTLRGQTKQTDRGCPSVEAVGMCWIMQEWYASPWTNSIKTLR